MDTRDLPRTLPTDPAEEISTNGFAVIPEVYTDVEIAAWLADWETAVGTVTDEAVSLRSRDALYGARNVLQIWPQAAEM